MHSREKCGRVRLSTGTGRAALVGGVPHRRPSWVRDGDGGDDGADGDDPRAVTSHVAEEVRLACRTTHESGGRARECMEASGVG